MPRLLLTLPLLLLLSACTPEPDLGPPAGWEGEGTERWWRAGADTALAFRDLSGFETMGISDREDGLRPEGPVVRNVQRRFLPMFRNHPELMDSIFAAAALPIIEREATGDSEEEREALIRRLNRRLHDEFYPAQPRTSQNPPLVMPDSLREAGVAGTITLQVYIDDDGHPAAIQKLEGAHPTMDAIVMRNYSERVWHAARLRGRPVASWTRAEVRVGG
jgi:hypothetical protein